MNVNDMTRKEFDALPWRQEFDSELICDNLVILPLKTRHDSGYRCMDFVACNGDEPVCRVAGGSDVLHIDGIGGMGNWNPRIEYPRTVPTKAWSIDCLPKSGLLRLIVGHAFKIKCGMALSSFEAYGVPA